MLYRIVNFTKNKNFYDILLSYSTGGAVIKSKEVIINMNTGERLSIRDYNKVIKLGFHPNDYFETANDDIPELIENLLHSLIEFQYTSIDKVSNYCRLVDKLLSINFTKIDTSLYNWACKDINNTFLADITVKDCVNAVSLGYTQLINIVNEYFPNKNKVKYLNKITNGRLLTDKQKFQKLIEINDNYIDTAIYYINHGILNLYSGWEDLKRYLKLCEDYSIPCLKGDFVKLYSQALEIAEIKQNEKVNSIIKEVQNTYNLSCFTNSEFTLEIPQTKEDFIRLGNEFHNCLGSYELNSYIKTKQRGVVIIRANDYKIACDYELESGKIIQSLLPCNVGIKDDETNKITAIELLQQYLFKVKPCQI